MQIHQLVQQGQVAFHPHQLKIHKDHSLIHRPIHNRNNNISLHIQAVLPIHNLLIHNQEVMVGADITGLPVVVVQVHPEVPDVKYQKQ